MLLLMEFLMRITPMKEAQDMELLGQTMIMMMILIYILPIGVKIDYIKIITTYLQILLKIQI